MPVQQQQQQQMKCTDIKELELAILKHGISKRVLALKSGVHYNTALNAFDGFGITPDTRKKLLIAGNELLKFKKNL